MNEERASLWMISVVFNWVFSEAKCLCVWMIVCWTGRGSRRDAAVPAVSVTGRVSHEKLPSLVRLNSQTATAWVKQISVSATLNQVHNCGNFSTSFTSSSFITQCLLFPKRKLIVCRQLGRGASPFSFFFFWIESRLHARYIYLSTLLSWSPVQESMFRIMALLSSELSWLITIAGGINQLYDILLLTLI